MFHVDEAALSMVLSKLNITIENVKRANRNKILTSVNEEKLVNSNQSRRL